jgi:hypothetical protein
VNLAEGVGLLATLLRRLESEPGQHEEHQGDEQDQERHELELTHGKSSTPISASLRARRTARPPSSPFNGLHVMTPRGPGPPGPVERSVSLRSRPGNGMLATVHKYRCADGRRRPYVSSRNPGDGSTCQRRGRRPLLRWALHERT